LFLISILKALIQHRKKKDRTCALCQMRGYYSLRINSFQSEKTFNVQCSMFQVFNSKFSHFSAFQWTTAWNG